MSHKKIFGAIRSEQSQFISLQEDNKLNNGAPEERELRTKYPFANVFLEFPTTGESAVFPAYMKAFQDTFSPTFSPISVFGRQDDIPVYQSTKRSISFSLVMPAYNELHAVDILRDINTIIKNLYPSYVKTETNKTRITNGLFIIEDEFGGSVYVKTYELSFNMSVLHEETPGFDPESGGFIESQQFPYTLQGDAIPFTAEQSEGIFNPAEQAAELTTISLSNGNAIGSLAKKIGKLITESGT